MNPTNGSNDVVCDLPDGGELRLPKLAPSDVVNLAKAIQQDRKRQLIENLAGLDLAPAERLARLNEFDSRPVKRSDLIMAAATPHVQLHMLRIARSRQLGREATEAEVDEIPIGSLEPMEQVDFFLALLNRVPRKAAQTPSESVAPSA